MKIVELKKKKIKNKKKCRVKKNVGFKKSLPK